MRKRRLKPSRAVLYISLILFSIIVIAPLVIVLSSSLREPDNLKTPLALFTEFSGSSYLRAFEKMNFPRALLNSILTTGLSVILVVLLASMAAYPISRIQTKISRFFYFFFIAGLIIPSPMVIVPVAQMFGRLNIPNNQFTPVIMFVTCSLPFSTFLYAGFMKSVPKEIEEAAYLDGAGLIRRFFMVVFPMLKHATVSVIITQGLWIWNDYFYPMVFVSRQSQQSLPVAMIQFLGDRENPAQWNVLFAACVLCALPLIVIFLILQKQFISGLTAGSTKG